MSWATHLVPQPEVIPKSLGFLLFRENGLIISSCDKIHTNRISKILVQISKNNYQGLQNYQEPWNVGFPIVE